LTPVDDKFIRYWQILRGMRSEKKEDPEWEWFDKADPIFFDGVFYPR
jgi:hypothetical protein